MYVIGCNLLDLNVFSPNRKRIERSRGGNKISRERKSDRRRSS